jgi:hypothetical protein
MNAVGPGLGRYTVWLLPEAIPGLHALPPIHIGWSLGHNSDRWHLEYEYGFGGGYFPLSLYAGGYYDTHSQYTGLFGFMAGMRTYWHMESLQNNDLGDIMRLTAFVAGDKAYGVVVGVGLEVSWIVPVAAFGAVLAAGSDIRLKTDIQRVGTSESGIPTYTFRYRGDPSGTTYFGTMAQELLETHPHAVTVRADGFYAVYYDLIDVDFYPVEVEGGEITELIDQ